MGAWRFIQKMLEFIFQDSKLLHTGHSSSKAKANVLGLEQILKRRQWFGKLTFNKRNKSVTKLAQVFWQNFSSVQLRICGCY